MAHSQQEHDNADTEVQLLKKLLAKAGLELHDVNTKGHCQFDAIAFQVGYRIGADGLGEDSITLFCPQRSSREPQPPFFPQSCLSSGSCLSYCRLDTFLVCLVLLYYSQA